MSMTALETVVEHVIPKTLISVIAKAAFKPVQASLLDALASCGLERDAEKIFEGRLKGLNGRSLSQKIQALRDHYALPAAVFSDKEIGDIVDVRNDIVHKGESKNDHDLWPKEVFVRALIARIVFHELAYEVPDESYIDGYRTVHPQTILDATADPGDDDPPPSDVRQ